MSVTYEKRIDLFLILFNIISSTLIFCEQPQLPIKIPVYEQQILKSENNIFFINLGQDCQATYYLQKLNLRKTAFPFDWLQTYNFSGVCKAIEEKFEFFLSKDYLEYNVRQTLIPQTRIKNTKYNLYFVHDFPTEYQSNVSKENGNFGIIKPNFLDYLLDMQKKYKKRIQRFLDLLNYNFYIIFIRTHTSFQRGLEFVKLMDNSYPKLNYKLILVNPNTADSTKKQVESKKIEQYYFNKIENNTGNKWWSQKEWEKLFKNF